jgi:hypothetical protein
MILNILLTAWSFPQFNSKTLVTLDVFSKFGSKSFLLVGTIAIKVNGITEKMIKPPTNHLMLELSCQANKELTNEIIAKLNCITAARL